VAAAARHAGGAGSAEAAAVVTGDPEAEPPGGSPRQTGPVALSGRSAFFVNEGLGPVSGSCLAGPLALAGALPEARSDRLVRAEFGAVSGSARRVIWLASAEREADLGSNTEADAPAALASSRRAVPPAPGELAGKLDPEGLFAAPAAPGSAVPDRVAGADCAGPAGAGDGAAGTSGHTDPDGLRATRVPSGRSGFARTTVAAVSAEPGGFGRSAVAAGPAAEPTANAPSAVPVLPSASVREFSVASP